MNEANIALLATNLAIFLAFAVLFIWGIYSGQFRDVEEPKYRMLSESCNREDGDNNA